MAALAIGPYTVRVSLSGFGTVEKTDIHLQSNETYNAGTLTLRAGMTETLPAFARDLLDRPIHATVASLESDGSPQLTLIWFNP